MPNLQQKFKSFNVKIILTLFAVVAVIAFFIIGFDYIETTIDLKHTALLLSTLIVLLAFISLYFLKNRLVDDLEIESLNKKIKELRQELDESIDNADYKTIYMANMSHEIRTPLNTVIGMLNMLNQTNLDDDQKAQVEIAEYSSEHLLQLVNMILDNTKADNEDVELNIAATNLEPTLFKLFKIFEYQAWDKDLEFEFEFLSKGKQKFYVLADAARIQQVLINLINNAIKFTNTGKITIIVDQKVSIDDDQIVTFYIKDTGVGMRSYDVKRVFDTSDKLDISTLRDYRGGGIGLSISRQLVKLMGGELKIESKENEGTTFYFSLQLKKTLNIESEKAKLHPIILNKFNVLVAEDNRMNQKVIKFLLEQQGADCTFAKNGLEAVELYKILDFDMVFMDIYMPDMDGYEATKKIRRTKKYSEHKTPVIAVSASAFKEDIANAKLAGIDDFLAKPIEVTKLKELLLKYASIDEHVID